MSISILTGQNGILNRATEAKEKTVAAQQEEKNTLNNYEDQISDYLGIDWEKVKANAKAPEEQKAERNNGVIGIGTDGRPVNMDLWEYTLLDDGLGYCLNDENSMDGHYSNSDEITPGYVGKFSTERKNNGNNTAIYK